MASPGRPSTANTVTDENTRRPYPRLTEAQIDRILADLLQEYALGNLRPVGTGEEITPAHNAQPE